MNQTRNNRRRGTSTAEVLISITLLGLAVLGVGRFSGLMRKSLESRKQAALVEWELENAKQIIASWPVDTVSTQRIAQLSLNQNVASRIKDAAWQAKVVPVEHPIPAVRVELRLVGEYNGQEIQPSDLVFWLPVQEPEA